MKNLLYLTLLLCFSFFLYTPVLTAQLRLRVDGNGTISGRLGIGTTTPTAPLHVIANSSDNPNQNGIHLYNPLNSANQYAMLSARVAGPAAGDPLLSLDVFGASGWSMGIDNSDGDKLKFSNAWRDLALATKMTIQTNGNVGIGTTTPTAPLHVIANSSDNPNQNGIHLYNPLNSANQYAMLSARVAGSSAADPLLSLDIIGQSGWSMGIDNSDGDKLKFSNAWRDLALATKMTIQTNGNVGIGTTTPTAPLHIIANSSDNPNQNGIHLYNPLNSANQYAMLSARVAGSSAADPLLSLDIFGESGWSVGIDNSDGNKLKFSNAWRDLALATKMTIQTNGNVGIGTTTPSGRLDVFGDIYQSGALLHASDVRFKQNIRPIPNVLSRLAKIRGVSYQFRTRRFEERNFSEGPQIGLIAQELEVVFPELVTTCTDGFKAVNYEGLIPVLIEAVKAQQEEIEEKEKRIKELETKLNRIEHLDRLLAQATTLEAKLADLDQLKTQMARLESGLQQCCLNYEPPSEQPMQQGGISPGEGAYLQQNSPNPFYQQTIIQYYLSTDTRHAEMSISDLTGKILKTFELQAGGGPGSLTLDGQMLLPGTYLYTLVVDGRIVDSKKMVLTK